MRYTKGCRFPGFRKIFGIVFLWFATVLVPRHCNSAAPTNISKSRDGFTLIVVDEVSGRAAWNRIELPGDDGPDFESGTSAISVVLRTHCSDTGIFAAETGTRFVLTAIRFSASWANRSRPGFRPVPRWFGAPLQPMHLARSLDSA